MKKKKKRGIQIPQLISIGVYTALYFVIVGISAMFTVFLIPGYSFIFIPIVSALLAGTVFSLMVAKVPQFGAITIMASIMGLFFFLSGRFPLALIPSIGFGLLADGLAYAFKYKSKKGLLLSYILFSYGTIGPILPFFFLPEFYAQDLVDRGRDMTYIDGAFANISNNTASVVAVLILISALIGGLFGQRMMKKHFEKAGIV